MVRWFAIHDTIFHYSDAIMSAMASQTSGVSIVYSTVWSGEDQINHQSSASLAFVRGIHRWPVNSPHKWPVTRKMFLFDDVIMTLKVLQQSGKCFHLMTSWTRWLLSWWPGDSTSHGISKPGIHTVLPEYSGFSTKELNSSDTTEWSYLGLTIV